MRRISAHSFEQVLGLPDPGTNSFPHTTQISGAAALCRRAIFSFMLTFALFHSMDFFRSFSRIASAEQSGQYFWRPALTVYFLPHRMQISSLPRGRTAPARFLRLCSRSRCRAISKRQVGQYLADGPPRNDTPHTTQTRVPSEVERSFLTHSGQVIAVLSPSKTEPHV